ncbi:hypothetical protein CSOJ01_05369 [Colletotrichum sojae]|uniref:Short-chain dehydrogenase n=1 Tax=Colletotrichum sojae TaxID=2175907 RepID=A0A8H6MXQ1_9PEZI|nr:hypothetical protein CSOJ01_05369 [Colletotrichum sojae]
MSRYQAVHENPQGPADARPTAAQIIKDEGLEGKLAGKVIFITGGNQGIGLETAKALYATGADIYLSTRDSTKGQKAVQDVLNSASSGGKVDYVEMSLDSLASVRQGAESLLSKTGGQLNILINNAGVMATPEGKTTDGFETQLATNHLGHFLLFNLLRPALLSSSTPSFNSRVVSLSSMAHRGGEVRLHDLNFTEPGSYDPFKAYAQSKTANIYLANEIERRYGGKGLHALSLHPGVIQTNLLVHVGDRLVKTLAGNEAFAKSMKSVEQGAATTVYAAVSAEWEGRGGKYLSDCGEKGPAAPGEIAKGPASADTGYAPWAFDGEKAGALWQESCKLVGVEDDA